MDPNLEFCTVRLRFRSLRTENAAQISLIRAADGVHNQLVIGPWPSIPEAENWIQNVTSRSHNLIFAISLRQTASVEENGTIGVIGLNRHDGIFYMFHPDYWGNGYCTEALHAFLDCLFQRQPGREAVKAYVLEDNKGSQRVLEKCGFTYHCSRLTPTNRVLSQKQETQLKAAVEGLGLQTGSHIPIARDPVPKLVCFLYVKPSKEQAPLAHV